MDHDVIVIGGSYAGMSAALQLARARRSVLVVDAGQRRNRYAQTSHGFLGQDGRAPGEIARNAREQLERYPSVRWLEDTVETVQTSPRGFVGRTSGGMEISGRRLVIATGVVDHLPPVPGVREGWGRTVFHCPYCHGYELDQGDIGVLAVSAHSMHHALMLPEWGRTTFFTNAVFEPDMTQREQLAARGVTVESVPVHEFRGDEAAMILGDGRIVPVKGLFVMPRTAISVPWTGASGPAIDEGPTGQFIRTDAMKQTTIRHVFACGDVARAAGSVALAVGDGAFAGAAVHRSLMFPGH